MQANLSCQKADPWLPRDGGGGRGKLQRAWGNRNVLHPDCGGFRGIYSC